MLALVAELKDTLAHAQLLVLQLQAKLDEMESELRAESGEPRAQGRGARPGHYEHMAVLPIAQRPPPAHLHPLGKKGDES